MDKKALNDLVMQARERGTIITKAHRCNKCGCSYYYTRAGRKVSTCLWCSHIKNNLPKKITEMIQKKNDGTEIFIGRKCSKCGNNERLVNKAHGFKEGACYHCAISKQSSKAATFQLSRLRQEIKKHTNAFIISSIQRSGTIEVSPRNWSDYWLVVALIEDCKRLNQKEEIDNTGIVWEIGHNFPASGGGTEYRGKATIDNLYLIRKEQNRSEKDKLPEQWSNTQVIWVGDLYNTLTSREAAEQWRERMGLNKLTPEEKQKIKDAEKVQNDLHYANMKKLSVDIINSLDCALSSESEFQKLYDTAIINMEKIDKQMKQKIETSRKNKESLWQSEGGLIEEALCGLKARYRIVSNTIGLFIESTNAKELTIKNSDKCIFLSEVNLCKRALVHWCKSVINNPRFEIEGFTHPFLEYVTTPKSWGLKRGDDGKLWLCGWLLKRDSDPVTLDMKEGRNAEHITMDMERFIKREQERKEVLTHQIKGMLDTALSYAAESIALSHTVEIEAPSNVYDTEERELHKIYGRKLCVQAAERKQKALDNLRAELNRWHVSCRKRHLSADDTEREGRGYIEQLTGYLDKPSPGKYYNDDVQKLIIKHYQNQMQEIENPY